MLRYNALIDAVSKSLADAPNSRLDESTTEFRLNSEWLTRDIYEAWSAILAEQRPAWLNLSIFDAGHSPIDLARNTFDDLEGQEFSVVVQKNLHANTFLFLTIEGFRNGLSDPNVERNATQIYIGSAFSPFKTHRCCFIPYADAIADGIPLPVPETGVDTIDIRKLVRSLTSEYTRPVIGFWLVSERPSAASEVWSVWTSAAAHKLALIPINEIWGAGGDLTIGLAGPKNGPRKRSIRANMAGLNVGSAFTPLTDAVSWICDVSREAAIRHTYLTSELAREWPSDDPDWTSQLHVRLPIALEGAKAHYEAHLLETSSEMLKTLSDLRKSVSEETQKAIDRTQSLLTALAGNLAAVLGVLLLRGPALLSTNPNSGEAVWTRVIFAALAVWFVFVCAFSLITNAKFRAALNDGRQKWHAKIHALLSSADFQQIASEPLKKAEHIYNVAASCVGVVYIIVTAGLGILAYDPHLPTRIWSRPPVIESQIAPPTSPTSNGPSLQQQTVAPSASISGNETKAPPAPSPEDLGKSKTDQAE